MSWIALLSLAGTGCAGVRAMLPMYTAVEPSDPLPIDGVYRLESLDKRYRIERGRVWLLEQVFIGPIRYDPGQVTARDLVQTAPNVYQGQDLGAMGALTLTAHEDRIHLSTLTPIGPSETTFWPIEIDDPAWYAAQLESDEILARSGGDAAGASALGFAAPSGGAATGAGAGEAIVQLSAGQRARFGRFHALVIGNDAYRSLPRLQTAVNDAEAVSRLLRDRYGFEVRLLKDANRAQILTALRGMRESLRPDDNLLIYYAGHGWLDKDVDEGYWLPVDADQESDVNWISNATITGYLRAIQAKHVMIVADSCYSGTLTRGIKLDVRPPDYLERMASQKARIVLSSGGLEPVADGGGGGRHSAFARHFLDTLRANEGVLDSTSLYAKLRRPVMLAADQAPELADIRKAGHEGGDFLFVPASR